jgi:hypothetical protein
VGYAHKTKTDKVKQYIKNLLKWLKELPKLAACGLLFKEAFSFVNKSNNPEKPFLTIYVITMASLVFLGTLYFIGEQIKDILKKIK